ncbi:MAG TPA: hypothetical protein VGW14_04455 [Thermoleophilaceae bacterium]|nr:hypothetical protein [Thermoleophilaceae bacterium]
MGTAVLPARRRLGVSAWTVAPSALALAFGVLYLVFEPRPGDLAVHVFRADLFGREGFTIWNGHWYGGHHTPAYSLLSGPLSWLLGPRLVLVLSCVACAALFEQLARRHFGPERARLGALWLGLGTVTLLATSRLPFALGAAFGLAAALALQRGRPRLAAAFAFLSPLASPATGLFTARAGLAYALSAGGTRRRGRVAAEAAPAAPDRRVRRLSGATVALAALAPALFLSLAFPEGGWAPFPFSAYLPIPLLCAACLVVLPREERALRAGAVLYALGATLAVAFETPMGGTASRLGMLFGGPVLLCAVWDRLRRPSPVLLVVALAGLAALGYWQWTSAIRDIDKAIHDPAAESGYFEPLRAFLGTLSDQRRLEIPFTSSRWENAEVAPLAPLARGWQRQLDTGRNPVFYRGDLNRLTYASWLAENAVRYVALPSAKPDRSSYAERALIEDGLPYLQLRWRSREWRVYEVLLAAPMVIPQGRANVVLEQFGSDELLLDVKRPGEALVRVRWTPYWFAAGGCVERAGRWTRVIAEERGFMRLSTRFAPERIVEHGRRCDDG